MAVKTLPPGPPGHFLTGHLSELRRDLLGLYLRCARDYGDVSLLRFGLKPVYLINHPDFIEQVLNSRNFIKHYALRMNRSLLGNGLLVSEGDFWLRQRRLLQPAFLPTRIASYAGVMIDYTQRHISTWSDGQKRDIHADMRQLTMQIAARTLFGADVDGQGPIVARALVQVMDSFNRRLFSVLRLPESVPTPGNIRAWLAVRRLDRILYEIISQRRADGQQDDLLSILLNARDEEGGMTDRQVRDEAMTLFLAGHETTALALTYTLFALAQHPEVAERLQQELRDVLGDRPPTVADLPQLRFCECVVQEGMRLYPPAYGVGRQVLESCEVAGYHLPAGVSILMLQYVVHRDPRFYDDPERFHPQRWMDGLLKRLPKYAYFPFGGGPRICIGNTFAMMEAVLVLACICRHWRVSPASDAPLRFRPRLTLAPDGPVELLLLRREQSRLESTLPSP
jgi:cytochrome P450